MKRYLLTFAAPLVVAVISISIVWKYVNPAPPNHLVIATSDGEGDYSVYAKQYQEIFKEEGIKLDIRVTDGSVENLKLLNDPKQNVDVAFVQDGLGSEAESPDVSSLGSIYYQPIWVFYRPSKEPGRRPNDLTRLSQLVGKRIAVGSEGTGTRLLATKLLAGAGVNKGNSTFDELEHDEAESELVAGKIDAAIFMATPEDEDVRALAANPAIRLMSLDQAEAITRQISYLHRLTLPHGSLDLARNIPDRDVELVAPTATLVVRDDLHSALGYLLLKAATQVHGEPGILEKRGEFPINKDDVFPLSDEAKAFYKTGTPFWHRYLPFWIATMVGRFLVLVLPLLVVLLPLFRVIPKIYNWRIRARIYRRYGELKFLETQIAQDKARARHDEWLRQLDAIEDRVNHTKVPLEVTDHIYALRQNIHFVRERLGPHQS